jgi:CubicO group peptidase (beta-lactamase class C family)
VTQLHGDLAAAGLQPQRVEQIRDYFDRFVDQGRVAGWLVTINRGGTLVWTGKGGARDRELGAPVELDTIWRLFSMTKPITAVAAMTLYEEGCFDLNDEISTWLPEFANARVYEGGPAAAMRTRPAMEPIRVHHLFTHTAGLTVAFQNTNSVDAAYRALGYDETTWTFPEGIDLAGAVRDWASVPLLFEPGTSWNYSVATDVLGRLIEIWGGETLDAFIQRRILDPLEMHDTHWHCPQDKADRLAMLYVNWEGQALPVPPLAVAATKAPTLLLGGGGLVSTALDFQRFAAMLAGRGAVGDVRIISERTHALMSENHLPGNETLATFSRDSFAEVGQAGVGFGLGLSVVVDPVANKSLVSPGSIAWGGAASTFFWADPAEQLSVCLYTQLLPSTSYPWRRALQQFVYTALSD